jgi:hypothetical protein
VDAGLAAYPGVVRTECGGDLKPGWLRFIGIMPAAAAIGMLAYRIDLAVAVSRLARSGASEEALLALLVDPLWRLEFALARAIGDQGSLTVMNTLGISLWALLSVVASALGIRGLKKHREAAQRCRRGTAWMEPRC